MILLMISAFSLLIFGSYKLLNINLTQMVDDIIQIISKDNENIQTIIKKANLNKKRKGFFSKLQQLFDEVQFILRITNRSHLFSVFCIASLIFLMGGLLIGLIMQNPYLAIVLSGGFFLLPFWVIKLSENSYLNQLNDELETALSVITTSYIRNDNIIKSVEENLYHINPSVQDVFETFLTETKYISSSIPEALERLSKRINNTIFEEWCLELIACQNNRYLKFTLPDILEKFSNVRMVNSDTGVDIYEPLREVLIVSGILLSFPIMIYFLNADWFYVLKNVWIGKITLALQMLSIFIAINGVVKETKPIIYERL